MAKISSIAVVLTALGACTLDEPARIDSVDFEESASIMGDEQAQELLVARERAATEIAHEALQLHRELVSRLESRGFTPEDALIAAETNDPERVRELFGFTAEEYAAANARVMRLGVQLMALPDAGLGDPEGLRCDARELLACGAPVVFEAVAHPHIAIAIFIGASIVCPVLMCDWEPGTSPGTKPKQK